MTKSPTEQDKSRLVAALEVISSIRGYRFSVSGTQGNLIMGNGSYMFGTDIDVDQRIILQCIAIIFEAIVSAHDRIDDINLNALPYLAKKEELQNSSEVSCSRAPDLPIPLIDVMLNARNDGFMKPRNPNERLRAADLVRLGYLRKSHDPDTISTFFVLTESGYKHLREHGL